MSPAMLMIDADFISIVSILITAIIGMVALSSSLIGYFIVKESLWERVAFALGGLMLIKPGTMTDILGIAIVGALIAYQWWRSKRAA